MSPRSVLTRVVIFIFLGFLVGIMVHEAGRYRMRFPAQLLSQICPDDRLYAGFTLPSGTLSNVQRFDGTSWVDAGQLATNVYALAEFSGLLYAAGSDHVYRCGLTNWQDLGTGDAGGFIYALASYNGFLYAARFGGHVDRYDSVNGWVDLGLVDPTVSKVESLVVFGGLLYAGAGNQVFAYDSECWIQVGGPFSGVDSIASLAVSGNQLYAGAGNNAGPGSGHVYRYVSGTSWADLGQLGNATDVRSLLEFNGELFAGTTTPDGGHVFVLRGSSWMDTGSLQATVTTFSSYHGTLYAGTSNQTGTNVYRWDGSSWISAAKIGTGVFSLAAPSLTGAPTSSAASSLVGYCCNQTLLQCDPKYSLP